MSISACSSLILHWQFGTWKLVSHHIVCCEPKRTFGANHHWWYHIQGCCQIYRWAIYMYSTIIIIQFFLGDIHALTNCRCGTYILSHCTSIKLLCCWNVWWVCACRDAQIAFSVLLFFSSNHFDETYDVRLSLSDKINKLILIISKALTKFLAWEFLSFVRFWLAVWCAAATTATTLYFDSGRISIFSD